MPRRLREKHLRGASSSRGARPIPHQPPRGSSFLGTQPSNANSLSFVVAQNAGQLPMSYGPPAAAPHAGEAEYKGSPSDDEEDGSLVAVFDMTRKFMMRANEPITVFRDMAEVSAAHRALVHPDQPRSLDIPAGALVECSFPLTTAPDGTRYVRCSTFDKDELRFDFWWLPDDGRCTAMSLAELLSAPRELDETHSDQLEEESATGEELDFDDDD